MREFDTIDDELFAERLDVFPLGTSPPATSGFGAPAPGTSAPGTFGFGASAPGASRVVPLPEPPTVRLAERPDRDPIIAIALAGLLVLVLVSTGVILWWLT
jgi:hypothetical protein